MTATCEKRLTVQEVAKRLDVSQQRVLYFIALGSLRAFNVSNGNERPRWRITPEALAEFEERKSNKPPAPPAPRRRKKTAERSYY